MTSEEWIYFLAILAVGLPAGVTFGWRPRLGNPTALAMVLTWALSRLIYGATGIGAPISLMVLCDWAVLCAIYSKDDSPGTAGIWRGRSVYDRAIIAIFPLAWLFYAPIVDAFYQYWTLYGIGLAQLMLAARDSAHPWLGRMAKKSRAQPADGPPFGLQFEAARAWAKPSRLG